MIETTEMWTMQMRLSFKFSKSTIGNCFCLETKKLTVSAKSCVTAINIVQEGLWIIL